MVHEWNTGWPCCHPFNLQQCHVSVSRPSDPLSWSMAAYKLYPCFSSTSRSVSAMMRVVTASSPEGNHGEPDSLISSDPFKSWFLWTMAPRASTRALHSSVDAFRTYILSVPRKEMLNQSHGGGGGCWYLKSSESINIVGQHFFFLRIC